MAKPTWDDRYATGIEQFDEDHKNLICQINTMHNMLISNKYEKEDYVNVLDSLEIYAKEHFAREEIWMLENAYPGSAEHINDHRRFSKKASEAIGDVKNGSARLTFDLLTFLRVWLLTHIAVLDADLGAFSRAKLGAWRAIGQ